MEAQKQLAEDWTLLGMNPITGFSIGKFNAAQSKERQRKLKLKKQLQHN